MSIETWCEEFMPVDAKETSDAKESVEHSIRKWEGLRKKNLKKHGLFVKYGDVFDASDKEGDSVFDVDASNCALCLNYACEKCPLAKARNGYPCNEPSHGLGEKISPWRNFLYAGDAMPMLKWLKAARKVIENGGK